MTDRRTDLAFRSRTADVQSINKRFASAFLALLLGIFSTIQVGKFTEKTNGQTLFRDRTMTIQFRERMKGRARVKYLCKSARAYQVRHA